MSDTETGRSARDAARAPADVPTIDLSERPRPLNPKSPRQAIQPAPAPSAPARSSQARHPVVRVLNFFLTGALLAVLLLGATLYFGRAQLNAPGPLAEPRSVMIPRGADLAAIAGILKRQNVIDSDFAFRLAAYATKAHASLKAGEYGFEPRVSLKGVLETLVSGRSILHGVTVPEGWTSEQVVARLLAEEALSGEIAAIPPEGSLAPDTYKFTRGTPRQEILDKMARAQEQRLRQVWETRADGLPVKSPEELLTLASIVEKETGRADERPQVAAVFINRLKQKMRLDSDPTFLYGVYGGAGKPPGTPVTQSAKESDTPYNTYKIKGLPPGPIANPGLDALKAVARPAASDHLYFVADGTGGHVFAKTLDEHNRNVQRWRQIEARQQGAAGQAPGADAPAAAAPAGQADAPASTEEADAGTEAPRGRPRS